MTSEERDSDLERRMSRLEAAVEKLSTKDIPDARQEIAILREGYRIWERAMDDFRDEMREELRKWTSAVENLSHEYQQHLVSEARNLKKIFISTAGSVITGVGTLGVLIWTAVEVIHRLPHS
jgi:lipoate-protein ligase A